MLYTCVTQYLGFRLFEEGTVMALAATGGPTYAAKFPRARSIQAGWTIFIQLGLPQPHALI
jgi:predicted NodU family carbamoyl transferase